MEHEGLLQRLTETQKKRDKDEYGVETSLAVLEKMQTGELKAPTDGFLQILNNWRGEGWLYRWEKDVHDMEAVWGKEGAVWGVEVEVTGELLNNQIREAVVPLDEVENDVPLGIERSLENWQRVWDERLEDELVELVNGWEDEYGMELTKRGFVRVIVKRGLYGGGAVNDELRGRLVRNVLAGDAFGEEYKQELAEALSGKDLFDYFSSWHKGYEWTGREQGMGAGNVLGKMVELYSKVLVPAIKHAGPLLRARGLSVEKWKGRFVTGEWEVFLAKQLRNGWRGNLTEKELTRCLWHLESRDVIDNVRPDLREASYNIRMNLELASWVGSVYKDMFEKGSYSLLDLKKLVKWGMEAWLVAREHGVEDEMVLRRIAWGGLVVKRMGGLKDYFKYWREVVDGGMLGYLRDYHNYEVVSKTKQTLKPMVDLLWKGFEKMNWPLNFLTEPARVLDDDGDKRAGDLFWQAHEVRRLVGGLLLVGSFVGDGRRSDVFEKWIRSAVEWSNVQVSGGKRDKRKLRKQYKRRTGEVVLGQMLWDAVMIQKGQKSWEDSFEPLPESADVAVEKWLERLKIKFNAERGRLRREYEQRRVAYREYD